MKEIKTKEDVLSFLEAYVDTHTCSQGNGKEVFFVSSGPNGEDEIVKGLPTGGCGDPHYLSRNQLFELIGRIKKDKITEDELEQWEFN